MSYAPQPGTTAFRAIAHLQTLEYGVEIINAQLAERVGVPPNTLHACMVRSLEARLVFSRQKGGHARSPTFWSLVDHQAASHAKPEAPAPARAAASHAEPAAHRNARPAGAIPAGDGSQKPDDAAAIPGARAGSDAHRSKAPSEAAQLGGKATSVDGHAERRPSRAQNTPQQGANRDASAGQSHVAGGSASPAGRGADGPTARGAAPDLSSYVSAIAERHPPDGAPAAPSRRGLRIAAWSTGELALELADGEVIVFGTAEANQIYSFCRRIGGGA